MDCKKARQVASRVYEDREAEFAALAIDVADYMLQRLPGNADLDDKMATGCSLSEILLARFRMSFFERIGE